MEPGKIFQSWPKSDAPYRRSGIRVYLWIKIRRGLCEGGSSWSSSSTPFSPLQNQQPTTESQLIPPNPTIKNFICAAVVLDLVVHTQLLINQPRLSPIVPNRAAIRCTTKRASPLGCSLLDVECSLSSTAPSPASQFEISNAKCSICNGAPDTTCVAPTLRGANRSITVSG